MKVIDEIYLLKGIAQSDSVETTHYYQYLAPEGPEALWAWVTLPENLPFDPELGVTRLELVRHQTTETLLHTKELT